MKDNFNNDSTILRELHKMREMVFDDDFFRETEDFVSSGIEGLIRQLEDLYLEQLSPDDILKLEASTIENAEWLEEMREQIYSHLMACVLVKMMNKLLATSKNQIDAYKQEVISCSGFVSNEIRSFTSEIYKIVEDTIKNGENGNEAFLKRVYEALSKGKTVIIQPDKEEETEKKFQA